MFVIEAEGFKASALRGLVTGILLLGPTRHTSHIAASVDGAAAWLPAPHARETGVALSSTELRVLLQTIQAAHAR